MYGAALKELLPFVCADLSFLVVDGRLQRFPFQLLERLHTVQEILDTISEAIEHEGRREDEEEGRTLLCVLPIK